MNQSKKKIIYVVNVDWFFMSHRLPLALEAIKRNYEVFLLTKNTGQFDYLEKLGITCINIDFERSGKNLLKELRLIFQLKRHYKKIKPDIIHHVTLKPSIYGTIAARYARIHSKIINAVSGLGYVFTENRKSLAKFITLSLLKYAFSNKKANFIFQNPDDRDFYDKMKFFDQNNFIIIKGSGVDENVFAEKIKQPSKQKSKIVLLARMLKDKGVFEFVRAAQILKTKYAEVIEFLLIGGIDLHNPAHITEEEIENLVDGNYIQWHGHQNNVKEIYESADIVCLPSYREGLPKSLVEAMATGCPIITTDAIGCRECVDEGVNGYLVPIGDHIKLAQRIEKLVTDKELRIKMGHHSRLKMVNEMSLSKVIEKTFNFYEK